MTADGTDMAHDGQGTGEIAARGPWIHPGYYKDPGRTEGLWARGWMHTGDVAHTDEYDYIQITDRCRS